jgi:hypothetical protein
MNNILKTTLVIGMLLLMVFVAGCEGDRVVKNTKTIPSNTIVKNLIPLDMNNTWIKSGEPTKSVYFYNVKFDDGSYTMQASPISQSRIYKDAIDGSNAYVNITTPEYTMECVAWQASCIWEYVGTGDFRNPPSDIYTFHIPKEAKS